MVCSGLVSRGAVRQGRQGMVRSGELGIGVAWQARRVEVRRGGVLRGGLRNGKLWQARSGQVSCVVLGSGELRSGMAGKVSHGS